MNPSIAASSNRIDYSKLYSEKGLYLHGFYIKYSEEAMLFQVRAEGSEQVEFESTEGYSCWQYCLDEAAKELDEVKFMEPK